MKEYNDRSFLINREKTAADYNIGGNINVYVNRLMGRLVFATGTGMEEYM